MKIVLPLALLFAAILTVGVLVAGKSNTSTQGGTATQEITQTETPAPTASIPNEVDDNDDGEDDDAKGTAATVPAGGSAAAASGATQSNQKPSAYTMADVAAHKDASSCWTAIRGSVYDVTTWISKHPGGRDAILKLCGKDGTTAFVGQHGDAKQQNDMLATFKIGTLSS